MDRIPCTMLESDDSDIEEGPDARHKANNAYQNPFSCIHMDSPDALFERWAKIKPEVRQNIGLKMHIAVFWWHILFRQQENHVTTAWAVEMGFLDSNVSNDLNLRRLQRIEILELVLNTVEVCLADREPERKAKELVLLSSSFRMGDEDTLMKAVSWLEECGPPGFSRRFLNLGPKHIRFHILDFIFAEYARYIQVMSCCKKQMIKELCLDPEPWSLQKSEEMKNKGNDQFQKKKYDLAVKWYTKAIKYHTNNHLLYGNRALSFLRSEKYLKAMGDGKRAIVLQRDWAKGHYRFCDALFYMGAKQKAVEANILAQVLCSTDPEGMKDLQQQYYRFMTESCEMKAEVKPKKSEAKKGAAKRHEGACGTEPQVLHPQKEPDTAPNSYDVENKQRAEDSVEQLEISGKSSTGEHTENTLKTSRDVKSEMGKHKKPVPSTPEKQAVRSKHPPAQEKPQTSGAGAGSKEQFCAAVQDAHTALADQRCRNAEQAFSLALSILESTGTKDLGITELDKSLLIYGYATALIEIGQPEELAEAQRQFDKLKSSGDRKFQSLVHYGIGKVYLKENRFSDALEQFSNAHLMVQRQITHGKLTWPTTKITVEETRPEYLKEQLESFIELCKFPPKPDAVCRHKQCLSQADIYFTDPDFKGFIRIMCCQSCKVEFHISCWKKLKVASFADKNDKEFLQDLCFTPDCPGKICHFVIFGSTGLIKCKFESSISKIKTPGKVRVRQPCTSLSKLKSKEERKQKRKEWRKALTLVKEDCLTQEQQTDNKETQNASPKDYTVYGDRVLHQIYESKELFNDEIHNISPMMACLRPWMDHDVAKGNVNVLNDRTDPQVMRDLVDMILERNNRVWARLFVHNLSDCLNVKPKLHDWAQQLDNAGLKAAEEFIDRYSKQLEELDLFSLLSFPPLKDVLTEHLGTLELFNNTGFTLPEYLRQAPPHEMRLFIWTLEEHREHYPVCCPGLDEYFEMDGVCLVIKKTENDDNLSLIYKSKSKHRKKKQKEPKPIIVLSGMRSGVLRDEEEDDFFSEEDSLMFLDDLDSFSVPDHLRQQVAEFEGHYAGSGHLTHYKRVLDNNPDPTKESLYDYFAQILEEHGPLEVSDPLLVGELENFPPEAQRKIDAAGGLQNFLLESLRFVMTEDLIGLTKHAVSLQHCVEDAAGISDYFLQAFEGEDLESRELSHLNPTAKEFLPQLDHLSLSDSSSSYDIPVPLSDDTSASALSEPTLPDPYVFNPHLSHNLDYMHASQDLHVFGTENHVHAAEYHDYLLSTDLNDYIFDFVSDINNINPYSERGGEPVSRNNYKEANNPENKATSVQTFKHSKYDVAINTEPYTLFEQNKGDMTQKEKNNVKFEKRIQTIMDTHESHQKQRKEDISKLEAELEEIRQIIEITNLELGLFQQKLEEEVRKDQQEKKENQETLKALKAEIKELTDLQESYTKQIQDKNKEYQSKLHRFLAKSNQLAADKMSLEDEIKRRKDVHARAAGRSLASQLSVLRNRQEHGLRGLRKCVLDGKTILQNLTEVSTRFPSGGLLSTVEAWKSCVQEAEEKIARTEAEYMELIESVKKGTRLDSLPLVIAPSAPAPPPVPPMMLSLFNQQPAPQPIPVGHTLPHAPYGVKQHFVRPPTHGGVNMPAERLTNSPPVSSFSVSQSEAPSAPTVPITKAPVAPPPVQQHLSVYEKIIDRLHLMFPHYSTAVLNKFIEEVRNANGGSLNMLSYEGVMNRAAQLILDHQENSREQMSSTSGVDSLRENVVPSPTPLNESSRATPTPPPPHAWKTVSSQHRTSSKALNMEDPCIICHEDMAPEQLCVLECRHSFHRECIKSWLKEQSTCPTCREHALLPEDFPMLPGRHRRGHMPAASFS